MKVRLTPLDVIFVVALFIGLPVGLIAGIQPLAIASGAIALLAFAFVAVRVVRRQLRPDDTDASV